MSRAPKDVLYGPGHTHLKLCGATKAGIVRFTSEGVALLTNGERLSVQDAEALARELSAAATVAKEFLARERGEHLWDLTATDGDIAVVKHRGSTARMRPVVNGRRQRDRVWKCSGCARDVPTGEKMYVCEGTPPFRWGRPRLCSRCLVSLDPIARIEALVSFTVPA